MSDGKRSYSRGDRAALIAFSGGRCYWPSCSEPLLKQVEGTFKIALEIAHICAANPNGERYVPEMSEDDRKSFDNLIFLCVAHHKTVDERGAESKYSIELLRKWKADREAGAPERLRGLRDVTEEKLVTMISSAIQQRDDDIKRTLDRLEKTDSEAAALIRELREELVAARRHGSLINSDVVGMLDRAASNLANLEDNAASLNRAADYLVNLEDNAASLNRAASYLINLEGYVDQIQNAANSLRNAAMQAADLNRFH